LKFFEASEVNLGSVKRKEKKIMSYRYIEIIGCKNLGRLYIPLCGILSSFNLEDSANGQFRILNVGL
jgi:hypothetical protein